MAGVNVDLLKIDDNRWLTVEHIREVVRMGDKETKVVMVDGASHDVDVPVARVLAALNGTSFRVVKR